MTIGESLTDHLNPCYQNIEFKKITSRPYHPESQSKCERSHNTSRRIPEKFEKGFEVGVRFTESRPFDKCFSNGSTPLSESV